jgi:carboxylesterase type B
MTGPIVETALGSVEGVVRDGAAQFLGIPYAAAPLGEQRFLAPQPAVPWSGVRRTAASRTSPPQLPSPLPVFSSEQAPIDEDCLELNVYSPAPDGGRRPVMVWFYGGGFTMGSAGIYDASSLAVRGDVVVVAVNYRLGALGFSYLEHLDERFAGSANAGIRDQIASLRWVKDNIAAFGGDPDCVTIFGESAGGHSVGCLLTSRLATDSPDPHMQNIWVNRPIDERLKKLWCKCGTHAISGAPRGVKFDPPQCPDLVFCLERTTGFEPATPTLARSSGAIQLPAPSPKHAARCAFPTDRS